MTLPKIDYPIHQIEIPSTKKKTKFRPFLVKEEKLLLMAKESNEPIEYLMAMKQVINNCCLEKNFKINDLSIFDIEYLFIQLRAVSVNNIVTLTYIDNEDSKEYRINVDLTKMTVTFPEKLSNNIAINDNFGLIMKYPSAELYDDKEFIQHSEDQLFDLIVKCVEQIYQGDTVYELKDYKKQDIISFVENLDLKTFEKINNFLTNVPKLYYKATYKNSLNHERVIELRNFEDFFP